MNSQKASMAGRTSIQLRTFMAIAFITATFSAVRCTAQALQAGISVDLPLVSHAIAVPDADNDDALIVAVTQNGDTYLGVDPITLTELAGKIKRALAFGSTKKVYIKADSRTPYDEVEKVLSAVRRAGATEPVLLIAQQESVQPGTVVPSKGIPVSIGPEAPSQSRSTLVQLLSGHPSPTVMVNRRRVSWTDLQNTLASLAQTRGDKIIQISADGLLPFSEVARAIDAARSTGAAVVLITLAS